MILSHDSDWAICVCVFFAISPTVCKLTWLQPCTVAPSSASLCSLVSKLKRKFRASVLFTLLSLRSTCSAAAAFEPMFFVPC